MHAKTVVNLGPVLIQVNWFILAGIVLVTATFFRLGLWQLDRASEKQALREAMQAAQLEDATAIEDVAISEFVDQADALANLRVTMAGEYLNENTFLLAPRFYGGQIGYGVITPFRLQINNQVVLVDRGWTTAILPAGSKPNIGAVSGPQQLTAQIHSPAMSLAPNDQPDASTWPVHIRHLEVDVISRILGEKLFPYPVRLTADQPGGLIRYWPAVTVNSNTNISYAIQWFAFTAIVIIASLLASSNIVSLFRRH